MSLDESGGATQTTQAINKEVIHFPNNNQAAAIYPPPNTKAEDIVTALDLQPYKAVLAIIGDAPSSDESLVLRLTQLFSRGIARAAAHADAVIIDDGRQAGVVRMIGEGSAGRGYTSQLIGVAPAAVITYPGHAATEAQLEPNHSRFVLVEGNTWGSETPTMYDLVKVLTSKMPAVAILAGGQPIAKDAVLRVVRQRLPLIVIEGSGGVAGEIAAAWKQRATLPDDPVMAEIIAEGDIHFHLLSNSVKGIERLVLRELEGDKILMQAWEMFADYDLNANLQQKRFNALQLAILIVGVVGTALAISQQVFGPKDPQGNLIVVSLSQDINSNFDLMTRVGWWSIHQLLIIIPILLTVLVTAANRFKQGNKWLFLRAGAESIKREIYRYRTRAMSYKEEPDRPSPEQQLSKKLEDITRRTMRTEVNTAARIPYNKDQGFPPYMYAAQSGDDGFSSLTPDRYVEVRLGDQLNYFQKRSVKLERQLKVLYWLTFIVGGVGTYLAAINQQVWIAFTTAIVAALGTYLGYRQTENTLTKYNQAATDLANIKTWWHTLSAEEQSQQQNIDSLVEHTEQVLESELDGWVQQMQNALAELRKEQKPPTETQEKREPQEPLLLPGSKQQNGQVGAVSPQGSGDANRDAKFPVESNRNQPPIDRINGESKAGLKGTSA